MTVHARQWLRSTVFAFAFVLAAASVGRAQEAPAARDSVWVNSSSRVYHCPGTRYYGATARGRFMSEDAAIAAGNRPAYGRGCRGATVTRGQAPQAPSASPPPAGGAQVWVNTSSRVYHCPGTRYYGNTKAGRYMSESAAIAAGHRAASGRRCS